MGDWSDLLRAVFRGLPELVAHSDACERRVGSVSPLAILIRMGYSPSQPAAFSRSLSEARRPVAAPRRRLTLRDLSMMGFCAVTRLRQLRMLSLSAMPRPTGLPRDVP